MIISVRVILKASSGLLKKEGEAFKAYLTKPAQGGLANKQLIGLLSAYFKLKKYQISIIKGAKSRDKLVRIDA